MISLFSKHTTLDADTLVTQETGTSLGLVFIKFAYNNPLQTDQPHTYKEYTGKAIPVSLLTFNSPHCVYSRFSSLWHCYEMHPLSCNVIKGIDSLIAPSSAACSHQEHDVCHRSASSTHSINNMNINAEMISCRDSFDCLNALLKSRPFDLDKHSLDLFTHCFYGLLTGTGSIIWWVR